MLGRRKPKPPTVVTPNPDTPAPNLICPSCDVALRFHETILGGLQPPERWDRYTCPRCGVFEYRHRTKQLKLVKPKQ